MTLSLKKHILIDLGTTSFKSNGTLECFHIMSIVESFAVSGGKDSLGVKLNLMSNPQFCAFFFLSVVGRQAGVVT